jgi:glycogen debranching enzyme
MAMRITHRLGTKLVKKEGEGNFLLTDHSGNFLTLGSPNNITHMQGLFSLDKNWDMYKSIDNFYLDKELTEIENGFSYVKRIYDSSEETFYLTATALIYEVKNYSGNILLDLDFRQMYNFDDTNRLYILKQKGDIIIISYPKHKKFFAIKGVNDFNKIDSWEKRFYPYDQLRGTKSEFYVYRAINIICNKNLKAYISMSDSEKDAIHNVESAAANEHTLKQVHEIKFKQNKKNTLAKTAAINSLESLRMNIGKGENHVDGVFAGLPWFFQIWSRDELISLKAYMLKGDLNFVKKRLFAYLNSIDETGRIPNRLPHSDLSSADSIGWLFKRIFDFINILEKKHELKKYLSKEELQIIKHKLHFSIEEHMTRYIKDYIVHNGVKETWVDTDVENQDGRPGACIEIQALFLGFFKLMEKLCLHLNLTYFGYRELEKSFLNKIKQEFYKDGALLDRLGSETQRPNLFIAYYVYPELLKKHEWETAFNKAIRNLWLDWGGLSSIEKNHPLYKQNYTGHNNLSYHRGDSWYWINNLAAICLADLNMKKYHHFIDNIYHASEKDLLFSGFIGHSSELSSASNQKSEGCLAQAWSVATFLELAEKLKKS